MGALCLQVKTLAGQKQSWKLWRIGLDKKGSTAYGGPCIQRRGLNLIYHVIFHTGKPLRTAMANGDRHGLSEQDGLQGGVSRNREGHSRRWWLLEKLEGMGSWTRVKRTPSTAEGHQRINRTHLVTSCNWCQNSEGRWPRMRKRQWKVKNNEKVLELINLEDKTNKLIKFTNRESLIRNKYKLPRQV